MKKGTAVGIILTVFFAWEYLLLFQHCRNKQIYKPRRKRRIQQLHVIKTLGNQHPRPNQNNQQRMRLVRAKQGDL
ncbi:hypothetical protein Lpp27_12609 [Lacticaseibacillus paracasei subsp. paracasei CNCM I-4648]|nr:hypothetical protein Lpp27_12609 [Lacticaseibacillus paracasei subsp. paracasei CNCM I-4648]